MAYDGKLLARARDELDKIREENRAEQQRRLARAYARLPELEEVDAAMRSQMTELVRLTVSRRPDLKQQIEELKRRNLDTQRRRAELLDRPQVQGHGHIPGGSLLLSGPALQPGADKGAGHPDAQGGREL